MRRVLGTLFSLLCVLSVLGRKPRTRTRLRRGPIPDSTSLLPRENVLLQQNVTWDQYSLSINGKRLIVFSGEVHPYRLPVQTLHLDVFQKIKAMGFNAVSFYVFWGIHEPKRGEISFEGFRDLQPFIDAAKKAGIYLIARPGPYINAETTGGGFPGWGTYTPGLWRTSNATYVDAYAGYIKAVGSIIAKNEITKGGPIILVQAENEYSGIQEPYTEDFDYEKRLYQDLRDSGITVPITTNDVYPSGHYTSVDIYGYDSYPHGFDCFHPYNWTADSVPEPLWGAHESINPEDLNAVYEFQGGAFDPWGGAGYSSCAVLTGPEFERVFYKNQVATSTTLLNLYMLYGGTNWGGIAHPGVYTSYDYGSAIAEDRTLREKYYELKLQANFLAVSPAFLTSRPMNIYNTQGSFTGNAALKTTQTLDVVGNKTGFYTVRHTDASSNQTESYTLTVASSLGTVTIPALGGSLTLAPKDSKIHVVDYVAGSTTLVYSTGEIMTWATVDGRDVIIIYGNAGELHETAFKTASGRTPTLKTLSGSPVGLKTKVVSGALIVQYTTTNQSVLQIGDAVVYIMDRANAYEYWVLHSPGAGDLGQYSNEHPVVVKGGYLLRSATITNGNLALTGDLNSTTALEVIAPVVGTETATFNGKRLSLSKTPHGTLLAHRTAALPEVRLPNMRTLNWKSSNSLPEISARYSDDKWVVANKKTTDNPAELQTPVVLYAGEYGFHTGNLLWRGHFNSTGSETGFKARLMGGTAFGYSVWLDSTFIGSWAGDPATNAFEGTFKFPSALRAGSSHVITILQDHMGYEEDWWAAADGFKEPRGIKSYSFIGGNATDIHTWKVTGNLGGESYVDRTRGPLNEGGLFGERQGWHLPGFDDESWAPGHPTTGLSAAGVSFYRTNFNLEIPRGVDYPMALVVTNSTLNPQRFRAQLYVNGYQFGKYVNHIGPQKTFPVPQGILNYQGENTVAVSLWAMDAGGAKLDGLDLQLTAKVESSMAQVVNQPHTAWKPRRNAY